DAFQCCAGVRISGGCMGAVAGVLYGPWRRVAHCGVRLLGVLQRLLPRGRDSRPGARHSARHPRVDLWCRRDVPDDEHLDPRLDAVAGGGEIELYRFGFHGAHLGAARRCDRDGADVMDRLRLAVLAAARLLAGTVRRSARWRLLSGVRAPPPEIPVPTRLA